MTERELSLRRERETSSIWERVFVEGRDSLLAELEATLVLPPEDGEQTETITEGRATSGAGKRTAFLLRAAKNVALRSVGTLKAIGLLVEEEGTGLQRAVEDSWDRFTLTREVLRPPNATAEGVLDAVGIYFDAAAEAVDPDSGTGRLIREVMRDKDHKYRPFLEDLTSLDLLDILIIRNWLVSEERQRRLPKDHALSPGVYNEDQGMAVNLKRLRERAEHHGFAFPRPKTGISPDIPLKLQASYWLNEAGLIDPETRWYFLKDILAGGKRIGRLLRGGYRNMWVATGRMSDLTHAGLPEYRDRWGVDNLTDAGRLVRDIASFDDFIFMVLPMGLNLLKRQRELGMEEPIAIKVFPQDKSRQIEIGSFVLDCSPSSLLEKESLAVLKTNLVASFVKAHAYYEKKGGLDDFSADDLENAYLYLKYLHLQNREKAGLEVQEQRFLDIGDGGLIGWNPARETSIFTFDLPSGLSTREGVRSTLQFSFNHGWELLVRNSGGIKREPIVQEKAREILMGTGLLTKNREIDPRLEKLLTIIGRDAGEGRIVNIEIMTKVGEIGREEPRLAFATDVILSGAKRVEGILPYVEVLKTLIEDGNLNRLIAKAWRERWGELKSYYEVDLKDAEKMRRELVSSFTVQNQGIEHLKRIGRL